jgi:hypothetical protein
MDQIRALRMRRKKPSIVGVVLLASEFAALPYPWAAPEAAIAWQLLPDIYIEPTEHIHTLDLSPLHGLRVQMSSRVDESRTTAALDALLRIEPEHAMGLIGEQLFIYDQGKLSFY